MFDHNVENVLPKSELNSFIPRMVVVRINMEWKKVVVRKRG